MKSIICFIIGIALLAPLSAQKRKEVYFPDIQGYHTLKCDFHIHTVFSDGSVWPVVRVDEAWREGLDAIAITDHLEYLPHKDDVSNNHNRSSEIAEKAGAGKDILIIRGSEITRAMPPGHSNALFLKDCNALDTPEYMNAFKAARAQNAFIFLNHPDWSRQQPDTTLWWKEHAELYQAGLLNGIEIVNGNEYSVVAHRWAMEKKLTLISGSDVHQPITFDYDFSVGEHRPMTLVFAKEKSVDGIKDALVNRRTVVYYQNNLVGEYSYLKELFEKSIRIEKVERGKKVIGVTIFNPTNVSFQLKKVKGNDPNLEFFREQTISAGAYTTFNLYEKVPTTNTAYDIKLVISNLLIAPETPMPFTMSLRVK